MYGIPEYRLPKSVVRDEISKIEALGVQFITNCMVGENNVTIDSLFRAGYDAIFMGTGTSVPQIWIPLQVQTFTVSARAHTSCTM